MPAKSRLVLFVFFLLFLSVNLFAQEIRQWVARVPSPLKSGNGSSMAMTTDDSGNVYVAGWINRPTTGIDIIVNKYSPDGQLFWSAYYDGGASGKPDVAMAIDVDTSHNVYVAGTSDGGNPNGIDFVTVKFNSAGSAILWAKLYDGPGHGDDRPVGIAVNDSFQVYVAGSSLGSATGLDFATVKYDVNGDTVWTRRYNGFANSTDYPTAMAIRAYTDVYVTGTTTDSTMLDFLTMKYDALTGDIIWSSRYNGPGNGNDVSRALVLRSSTEVYVTGSSKDSLLGYDYATIKYKADSGSVQWVSRYNGTANGDDIPYGIAVYSTSRVYVTGRSLGFGSFDDAFTIGYSQGAGDSLWQSRFNGSGNDEDYGVAITGESNPIMLASVTNAGVGRDFGLIKIDGSGGGSGNVQLQTIYNGIGNDDDIPKFLQGTSSTYYVGGTSAGLKNTHMITIKYVDKNRVKYRTFIQDSLAGKSVSLKSPAAIPNLANVRDTAFARVFPKVKKGIPGYPGGLVVGNVRNDGASVYGWIRLTKGTSMTTLLPSTGTPRGFDSIGGKTFVGEKKDPKKDKYNNRLVGQLVALKMNIAGSDAEVTPPTLGDLTYEIFDTVSGIPLKGKSLRQIASLTDNFLTYWQSYPSVNWIQLDTILAKINGAFTGPLKLVSSQPLVTAGAVSIDSVSFLNPGIAPIENPLAFPRNSIEEIPRIFALFQNYPNPFNPTTKIEFELPQSSVVTLKLYDVLGQEVATIFDEQQMDGGLRQVVFDAGGIASGVYFYRLLVNNGEFQQVKKMIVIK